eukprot:187134-Rhodomonas_salina.1
MRVRGPRYGIRLRCKARIALVIRDAFAVPGPETRAWDTGYGIRVAFIRQREDTRAGSVLLSSRMCRIATRSTCMCRIAHTPRPSHTSDTRKRERERERET